MECDTQGRILWMSGRARDRLGPVESLAGALPAGDLPRASHLFQSHEATARRGVTSTIQCAGRTGRVPIHLERVLALENRVVLSAEVHSRASDTLPPYDEILRILLALQSRAVENYFRLRRAQKWLASQDRRRRRSSGALVSEALERERTRVARELHTGVGQSLAGIKINLELIETAMPEAPAALRDSLERIRALADEALSEVRFVSQRLHPPDWHRLDLREALELVWNTSGIPEKFHATLEVHPLETNLPDAVRFAVYRSAQEGLANVLRHAGATEVRLELEQRDDQIHLAIEDDGRGFDAREAVDGAPAVRGIGLRAMREEILALNGQFHLASGQDGTRMEIMIPITENR